MTPGVDENPRKKLFNTLTTYKDPYVSDYFKKYTFEEFENKLLTDKQSQDALFGEVSGLGIVKDRKQFDATYLSPAKAPAEQKKTAAVAAPAVAPAAPVVEEKPKSGRLAYEKVEAPQKTTASKILTGIGTAIDFLATPIKMGYALGEGLIKGGKETPIVKGYNQQKPYSDVTAPTTGAEADVRKFLRGYDDLNKKRFDAEEKLRQEKKFLQDYKIAAKNTGIPLSIQQEKIKKSEAAIYQQQLILNSTKGEYEAKSLQFNDRVEKWASDEAAKAPNNAFTTDKSGLQTVNPQYVIEKTNKLVEKMGGNVSEATYKLIKTKLSQALQWSREEPFFKEEFGKKFKELSGGLDPTQAMQQEFEELANPKVLKTKAEIEWNNIEKGLIKEKTTAIDAESAAYKTTIGGIQEEMKNDPELRAAIDEFDKKIFDPLQLAVTENRMSAEKATEMLNSAEAKKTREKFIDETVAKKYGPRMTELYNQYLAKVSQINNDVERRAKAEASSIDKAYKKKASASIKAVSAKYQPSPKIKEWSKQASDFALKKVEERSKMSLRRSDIEKNLWNQFVGSTLNGLANGISSTGSLFNLRNITNFGEVLAAQNPVSDLMIEDWNSYSFNKEGITKLVNTIGVQGGQMVPIIGATAAVAAATRGMGTTSLLSRLLMTAVPQWAGATIQMAGQAKEDIYKQTGDWSKATEGATKTIEGQMYAIPAYLLTGLKYFQDAGKILMPVGKLGRYATSPMRLALQLGAEVVGETTEEFVENANADAVIKGKDVNFSNIYKSLTLENLSKTAAQVAPLSAIMGGAPALYKEGKASINEIIAGGFYAKNILGKVSNPALLKENQVQWLINLYQQRGEGFVGGMISTMLHRGDIDKQRAQVLAQKLENYKNFNTIKQIQAVENPLVKQAAFVLYNKYQEAKNSGNKEATTAAFEEYKKYMSGKGAELVMVRMPDGDYQIYSYEDFNSLMDNKEFQKAASKNDSKHGGVFEITPLIQSNEELQNPKLQQIIERFDAIKNSEEEVTTKEDKEEAPEISDDEILAGQKRTGFQAPTIETTLPVEYAAIMDAVRSKEGGVSPNEIKETIRYLYDLRKIYANMMRSSSRNLTADQIEDITNDITEAINDLSNYQDDLSYEEGNIPEPDDTAPTVVGPSAQEVAAQNLEEKVAADIKAGRFSNATFNSESEVPEALQPYMERAVKFKQDGITKIQITAPASLIEQAMAPAEETDVVEELPVSEEAPVTEEAPVLEELPVTEEAPVVEEPVVSEETPVEEEPARGEPTPTEKPAKPKAKINLFTDEDARSSFDQKQLDTYQKLLFNGQGDMARKMVDAQKQRLVNKEVEQVKRGEVSEKVKAFYKKFGIGIETVSADDFVRILKENGESASRTQEGVFDDKNGKIYINKDSFQAGLGTLVIWHEAVHPIMNIIHNSNKPLYDKIHRAIEAGIKENPDGGLAEAKKWVDRTYTDANGYNDASRKDELIVEVIAMLASGQLSFNEIQPNLRQQLIDLINRIGRIMGLSTKEVSGMQALKDLAEKITTEINKAGEGDLSKIVGIENVGKFQRPGGLAGTQARAGATTSVKDIDVKNIRTLARPGNRVSKGLAIYSRNNQKIVEEAPDLSIEYVKENAPEIFISNANIISKFPIVSGIQKFGKISTVEEAQKVYDVFVREVADNLKFLMDEFNPEFRDVSTLWYDGANILAQNLAKQYSISTEQAAAMIASLSPQKDWYQNVRLAEMVMMAFDENPEMSKKMVDKQKLINIEGEKSDKSKIRKAEKEYETALANYSATPSKENRLAVKEAKDNVKKRKDALAKKIVAGKKLIEKLNSLVGKKMNNAPKDMKAYYARLWNEINTTKDYDVLRPDGVVIGPAYKLNGTKAKVAWGSYGEIGKAVAIYLDGSQENITRTLGEMHKIRNFNNNIIDPMSKDNDVTMDTHAIAAALLMALSGKSKQVTQNFGTGTSNSGALGIKGLYYAYAEAYILAAKEVGLLPRQVQSITWEAVRGLFTDTYKNNKENVKKINDIWSDYSNGKLSIDEARRAILKEAGGINDPTWSGPVSTESGIDTKQKGVGRGGDGAGRVSVGRDTGRGGKRGGISGSQASLGGRSEQAGDRGGRSEGRTLAPLSGAPNVPGASGPDPGLVSVAEKYAKEKGIDLRRQAEYVELDEDRAVRLANAYEEMPHAPEDPKVKEAYADLIRQTKDQFNALSDAGYTFTFFDRDTDPYDAKPWRAMKDLRNNKTMAVYGTYDGYGTEGVTGAMIENNPMLEDTGLRWPDQKGVMHPVTANDLFRAVHDAFGHGLEGAGFRARGEENAWQAHVRLFTGPAVAAITSETRGQNSWLNYGPLGEKNRTADLANTDFALQKTGLMPEWTWTEGRAADMAPSGMQPSLGGRMSGTVLVDKEGNKLAKRGDQFTVEQLVSDINHPIYGPIFKHYAGKNKPIVLFGGRGDSEGLARWSLAAKDIKFNVNHTKYVNMVGDQESLDYLVAHEIIHAIVDEYIRKDESAFDSFNKELSELKDILFEQDTEGLSPKLKEYLGYIKSGQPEELIAYSFTDPEVAAYFNSIKVSDRPGAKTIWNRIVDAVLKIVNQSISNKSLLNAVTETFNKYSQDFTAKQASLGGRQAAPSFAELDKVLDMSPVKSRAAREKLIEQYGKETVDRMIEISRNFTKIINGLEEQGVVEKDCP